MTLFLSITLKSDILHAIDEGNISLVTSYTFLLVPVRYLGFFVISSTGPLSEITF